MPVVLPDEACLEGDEEGQAKADGDDRELASHASLAPQDQQNRHCPGNERQDGHCGVGPERHRGRVPGSGREPIGDVAGNPAKRLTGEKPPAKPRGNVKGQRRPNAASGDEEPRRNEQDDGAPESEVRELHQAEPREECREHPSGDCQRLRLHRPRRRDDEQRDDRDERRFEAQADDEQ